ATLEPNARARDVRPRGERAVDRGERGVGTERIVAGRVHPVHDGLPAVRLEPAPARARHQRERVDRLALEPRIRALRRPRAEGRRGARAGVGDGAPDGPQQAREWYAATRAVRADDEPV